MSTQKLVALKQGFYGGSLIRIGQEFDFSGPKLPKWAALKEAVTTRESGRPVRINGDTKPKATQAAVKRKAEAAGDPPEAA